ncbi:MAG: DUF559 domain-containing protein [Dermatophilaceae bacterium]
MPMPLTPLPETLFGRPFSVREALGSGVPRERLRHAGLVRAAHGLRTPTEPATLAQATTALARILTEPWAWSHETAAELCGLPVPHPWQPGDRLSVMRTSAGGPIRRPQVRGRVGLERRATVERLGMPVVNPYTTWCDLAVEVSRDDAVVLGDAIAAWPVSPDDVRLGLTSWVRLEAEVMHRIGAPGSRRVRTAYLAVRGGSRSPMESLARLCFIDAGLPEPELNLDVLDEGRWVATVDFAWPWARVIVEYQGDHHRTNRRQWQHDLQRLALLQDLGWTVILISSADLATAHARQQLVARVERALGLARG